jgi:hypothetical protein
MKVAELLGLDPGKVTESNKFDLLDGFEIWTTNEERELLRKLTKPVKLSQLEEHDQFRIQAMIRKSLITKIGHKDPMVVANEKK